MITSEEAAALDRRLEAQASDFDQPANKRRDATARLLKDMLTRSLDAGGRLADALEPGEAEQLRARLAPERPAWKRTPTGWALTVSVGGATAAVISPEEAAVLRTFMDRAGIVVRLLEKAGRYYVRWREGDLWSVARFDGALWHGEAGSSTEPPYLIGQRLPPEDAEP